MRVCLRVSPRLLDRDISNKYRVSGSRRCLLRSKNGRVLRPYFAKISTNLRGGKADGNRVNQRLQVTKSGPNSHREKSWKMSQIMPPSNTDCQHNRTNPQSAHPTTARSRGGKDNMPGIEGEDITRLTSTQHNYPNETRTMNETDQVSKSNTKELGHECWRFAKCTFKIVWLVEVNWWKR